MGITVNVKWKFKVNGKEYGSVEEMPANVREAYERVKGTSRIASTKVVFNGQEYESVEAMPDDVRRVYDTVMKAAETGKIPAEVISSAEIGPPTRVQDATGATRSINRPRPIEPESILSLSPRILIVGLTLLALLLGLYFAIHPRRSGSVLLGLSNSPFLRFSCPTIPHSICPLPKFIESLASTETAKSVYEIQHSLQETRAIGCTARVR